MAFWFIRQACFHMSRNIDREERLWQRQERMWDREMERWDEERQAWSKREHFLMSQISSLQALVVSKNVDMLCERFLVLQCRPDRGAHKVQILMGPACRQAGAPVQGTGRAAAQQWQQRERPGRPAPCAARAAIPSAVLA